MPRSGLRARHSLSVLSILSLFITTFSPISLSPATAAPALVTCVNLQTGTERISHTGKCRITQEAQANWHKNLTDSPIASGPSAKVIVICSNKESSPVSYQVIRKKCARHQVTTVFSRSGSLPSKPVIVEAVSYGHDNASLKLAVDPAANIDAPIAYYTITSTTVDTRTPIIVQSQRVHYWKDLNVVINTLQASTRYTFSVTATTADGTSAISALSNQVTTPAYVPPVSTSSSNSSTVAAPAFSISSTSETKIVNNAISGYTIDASAGGAIASYAISPAAPAGITFNTSSGLLSGTPTATQSATTYTITATNASGSATRTFTLTVQAALTAPVISLSKTAETTTAFIASVDFGYTISSTGGAIASYALTGTLPAGLSFSTSTGLITGTPEETRTATTYTITATNAAGSTSATYRLRVTGDLGDTGPGGGTIFYVAASTFTQESATGTMCTTTCRYLEVAPSTWNSVSDPTRTWSNSSDFSYDVVGVTKQHSGWNTSAGVGRGYKDSLAIVTYGRGIDSTTAAAALARAYSGGSKGDWYLPSPVELNLLCQWARGVPSSITTGCTGGALNSATGLQGSAYWSSTQDNGYPPYAVYLNFSNGIQDTALKNSTLRVRPIRAF